MKHSFYFLFTILILAACSSKKKAVYTSGNLQIEKLTPNTYVHITSYHKGEWGKVACNGLVYISNGEAIVFDTPVNDSLSRELISWITNTMKSKVKAIVVNHFHDDCLGGLKAFHDEGIPSYSSYRTIIAAKNDTANHPTVPVHGFDSVLILKIGGNDIVNRFVGEAHTRDNIVSYVSSERVLFGGCMIKSLGAGKGYLGDANLATWSNTVRSVKTFFPDVRYVIPGHGKYGNASLLDYTIKMFETR